MDQVSRDHIKQIYAIFAHRPALWTALRAISAAPHVVLRVTTPFVGVGEAKNIEASSLALSAMQSGALSYTDRMRHFTCKGEKWRFLNVYDRRVERNDDIPANRFVVHFIRYSTRLLKDCARQVVADEILCEYEARFRGSHSRHRVGAFSSSSNGDAFAPAARRSNLAISSALSRRIRCLFGVRIDRIIAIITRRT